MNNNKFRTPLLQSAAVLGGVIVLALIAASSGSGNEGGGFFSLMAGIGNTILFIIGLAVGLSLCIALLVGIFLAAVGMVSPEQASQMYFQLKKNFAQSLIAWSTNKQGGSDNWVSAEEYSRMKQEIIDLQNTNKSLTQRIKELEDNDLKMGEK